MDEPSSQEFVPRSRNLSFTGDYCQPVTNHFASNADRYDKLDPRLVKKYESSPKSNVRV